MTEPLRVLVVDDEPYITDVLSSALVVEGFAIDGDRAVLEAQDRGPGLDADRAARAFDRFYRGTPATRDSGSGPGPFIAARLARAFGGSVSVVSEPGAGSTSTVELALATTAPAGSLAVSAPDIAAVPVEPSRTPDARREDAAGDSDGAVTPLLPGSRAGHR